MSQHLDRVDRVVLKVRRALTPQEMIMFLQRLPTHSWTDHDVELLLSEAFVLKTVWQGAENHFANMPQGQGGFGMLGR
jgi:hypothetical protein